MSVRERLSMDSGWRFHAGEYPFPAAHAGWLKSGNFTFPPLGKDFDDSGWRVLDLPHDFVVEGEFKRSLADAANGSAVDSWPLHTSHGSLAGGIGWYRKRFERPRAGRGGRLSLEFDGVARDCSVWLNHHYLGRHLSGFTGFRFDITEIAEELNTLVVRVDATQYEGWFYEGGGIYRHVWLVGHDAVHVAPDGLFVTADVRENGGQGAEADVVAQTTMRNETDEPASVRLALAIADPDGRPAAAGAWDAVIPAGGEVTLAPRLRVNQAALWSVETPRLYTLTATLLIARRPIDRVCVPFGLRSIRFDADRGFFLNGRPLKLKGVCCHQDHAGLGAALPDRVQEFRIQTLKQMGCNAYRCSHNPPTPELLDACDRLGMLVMDENRLLCSSPESRGQLEALVKRDRNHPSVILWSLGNEELIQGAESGARIAAALRRQVRRLDPTRPVTLAMNGSWGQGASRSIDVQGCNYINLGDVDAFHRAFPAQPIVFAESASTVGTRGIYEDDPAKGYLRAYDGTHPALFHGSPAEANWRHCLARPFVSGTFVWTGFDYRGEPSPCGWPCISSHFGILDTCGFPKDNFFYYQAWWTDRPVLHILPHWNWPGKEGERISVWVQTNCETVELSLNGRLVGRKRVPRARHVEWKVPYQPGELVARGFSAGRKPLVTRVRTTGPAASIRLTPDRPRLTGDGEDVAMIRVEIADSRGLVVPTADNPVTFTVRSGGRLLGVGNGDPSSHEPDKGTQRSAFNGLCQAIVQANAGRAPVVIEAASPGLKPARLTIPVAPGRRRPQAPGMPFYRPPAYACSALLPAPADIRRARPPGGSAVFEPIASKPDGLCNIHERHGDRHGLCYIRVDIDSPRACKGAFRYGADGPVKVWVNGRVVDCRPEATNPVCAASDGKYEVAATWRRGINRVIFALCTNRGKAWGIYCRPIYR